MTRGKIIYIGSNALVYETVEFNGDMHPDNRGERITEFFHKGGFQTVENFEGFVNTFNKKYFGYDEILVTRFGHKEERVIDVSNNWTDYLYIINESDSNWKIMEKETEYLLTPTSIAVVDFKKLETICRRELHDTQACILGKREFADCINRLKEASDLKEKVDKLFRESRSNMEEDICNVASLQISHESIVVSLLKKIMNDKHNDIDYFIYELDYGRKYEHDYVKDANGNNIDFSTAESLYDYLVNENK